MQSLNFSELIIEKARKQGKKAILIIGEEPVIKKHINNVIQNIFNLNGQNTIINIVWSKLLYP